MWLASCVNNECLCLYHTILPEKYHTKESTMMCSTMEPSPNNGSSSVVDIIPLAVASYQVEFSSWLGSILFLKGKSRLLNCCYIPVMEIEIIAYKQHVQVGYSFYKQRGQLATCTQIPTHLKCTCMFLNL